MKTRALACASVMSACVALTSAALGQDTAPAPDPTPVPIPPAVVSVAGQWECNRPAIVTVTVRGGSTGAQGIVTIRRDGTAPAAEQSFTVAPRATQNVSVAAHRKLCPDHMPGVLVVETRLTPPKGTLIRKTKYLDFDTATLQTTRYPRL